MLSSHKTHVTHPSSQQILINEDPLLYRDAIRIKNSNEVELQDKRREMLKKQK